MEAAKLVAQAITYISLLHPTDDRHPWVEMNTGTNIWTADPDV